MSRLSLVALGRGSLNQNNDPLLAIAMSLMAASVLTVYPIPYDLVSWRPVFMLMVSLFWVMYQPRWCGVWFAFFVGLACDVMVDTQLGQQAFSFVVVAFAVRYVVQNRRVLTFSNAWVLVALGVFLHLLLMFVLQKLSGQMLSLHHWLAWLPTVLMWPMLVYSLKRWRT